MKVPSTADDFIVHFGDFKPIKNSEGKTIGFVGGGIEGLAEVVSFKDNGKWIYVNFDENGKLSHIGKGSGDWISVDDETGSLAEVSSTSGSTVQKIIEDAKKGGVSFSDFSNRFYADKELTKNAAVYFVESYQQNFLSISGENIAVGGKGSVDVLRNLNSIVGYEAKDFTVNVGNIPLEFNGKDINGPRKVSIESQFVVKEINAYSQGKFRDEFYTIKDNGNGKKILDTSTGLFSAGRETFLLPYGSSIDVSVQVSNKDFDKIAKSIESASGGIIDTPKEMLVQGLLSSNGRLQIDAYVPLLDKIPGIQGDKEKIKWALENNIFPSMSKSFTIPSDVDVPIDKTGEFQLRQTKINAIKSLILDSIPDNPKIQGGQISLSIENNPSDYPIVSISSSGREISRVEARNIQQADTVLTLFEAGIRTPYFEKGKVNIELGTGGYISTATNLIYSNPGLISEVINSKKSNQESYYSIRPSLYRLWYNNLGRGSGKFDNIAGVKDLLFVKSAAFSHLEKVQKE